jgi:hypothetical protein
VDVHAPMVAATASSGAESPASRGRLYGLWR